MKIGDIIQISYSNECYIVSAGGDGIVPKVQLTNIRNGKRWSSFVKVSDYFNISSEESEELVSDNDYIFKRKDGEVL